MKLAEALIRRADAQRRIDQLKARLIRNTQVAEGDSPDEDPAQLLADLEATAVALLELVQRINRTNCRTPLEGHGTIADAIAERDNLKLRAAALRDLANSGTRSLHMMVQSEMRIVSTIDVRAIQQRADAVAQACRELDTRIQESNWFTDLVD